jgi:hypothetical protein
VTLLSAEIRTFRQANKAFSKYRRAKKTRLHQGEVLTIKNTNYILAQEEVEKQIRCNKRSSRISRNKGQSGIRCYSICREGGYNSRICQEVIIIEEQSDSE